MQTIILSIHENHLAKFINFLVSLPKDDVKVLESFSTIKSNTAHDKLSLNQDVPVIDFDNILQLSMADYLDDEKSNIDDKWLNNLFALMDSSVANSEIKGIKLTNQDDRNWTRDELYER